MPIQTHFEIGKKVRQTIKELGGTMPEELPLPAKSVAQLDKVISESRESKSTNLHLFNGK